MKERQKSTMSMCFALLLACCAIAGHDCSETKDAKYSEISVSDSAFIKVHKLIQKSDENKEEKTKDEKVKAKQIADATWIRPSFTELYSAETKGTKGIWGSRQICPNHEFVYGFRLKSQRNQRNGDDTGLNGIELYCRGGGSVKSKEGRWGNWMSPRFCRRFQPVTGFQMKMEKPSNDYTAANNVNLWCRGVRSQRGYYIHGEVHTDWGNWSQLLMCPHGMAAVGIQTRVQNPCGGCDDSAMNGMKLLCAKYRHGPFDKEHTKYSKCGGKISSKTTSIKYPESGKYPNNAKCTWIISRPGKSFKIKVTTMNIETHQSCKYDFLQFGNGAKYCGNELPPEQNTTDGSPIKIVFSSDGSVTRSGFSLKIIDIVNPEFKLGTPGTTTCPEGFKLLTDQRICETEAREFFNTKLGTSGCWDFDAVGCVHKTNAIYFNSCKSSRNTGKYFTPVCEQVSQCGVQNYQTPDRIVNGRNAEPGEWPWMVGLYYSPFVNDGGSPECGGTLIRDDVVVTAAHCMKPGVPPCSYAVRVGDHDLRQNGPQEEAVYVSKVHIPEQYDKERKINDIAILFLKKKVKLSNQVQVACLPTEPVTVDANCYATGWGLLQWDAKRYQRPNILQEARLPLYTKSECQAAYASKGNVSDDMLCAGYKEGGKDTCRGDSGGPLVCKIPGTNRFELRGVTSFGPDECGEVKNQPGVYQRVFHHLKWINEKLKQQGSRTTSVENRFRARARGYGRHAKGYWRPGRRGDNDAQDM